MKLLRTIRLDASDAFLFPSAAEDGEWAISGAFLFSEMSPEALTGQHLSAFRGGFLGVPSFGWSTLAQIVEVSAEDRAAAIDLLAHRFVEQLGAPDHQTARRAATEEIDFAISLCDQPAGTLIAVDRRHEDGAVREAFRTLRPRDDFQQWPAIAIDDGSNEEEQPT
jgi:Family of unknown function (DUF6505)